MKYNKNEVTGKMRDRIILQNVTRVRSLTGFASEIWTDTTTIWAFAESKLPGSNETIIEGKNTAKNICDFTIRYISSITEESRVVFKNKIYQVKNIKISHDRRFISFQGVYYDSYSTVIGLQSCSASLLAQSSLSAALMRVIKYQASLNAFGSVSADIALVQKVASSLNAFGTLTGDITFVKNMQAALNGTAALSGGINFVQKVQASLLTSANVTGDITIPKLVQASLTGAGTTAADLTVQSAGFDADAQAFFDRVTTAGGTLTTTEQNAVNTLVIQMKADGIWTKMKAIYPMVGASAAACAQNLKSASFTGVFTTGWTFASTGATGNGASAYMDTNFNPNTSLNVNSKHLSYYSRNNFINCQIGIFQNNIDQIFYIGGGYYNILSSNVTGHSPIILASTRGFIIASRTSSETGSITYLNNVNIGNDLRPATGNPNNNIWINARNSNVSGTASNNQCAFTSIGDGLTDTEAANFYTAVQAFQTSLNRQVN